MATPSTSPFPLTGDLFIDVSTNGYYWNLSSNRTVYWSIADGFYGEFWNDPVNTASALDLAFSTFSYYANVNFSFTGYYSNPYNAYQAGSDITISMDGAEALFDSPYTWAMGFFPNASYDNNPYLYPGASGDIYLNLNSQANYLSSYSPGSAGFFLVLHEIGHTLGLKHPHDDGGTFRPILSELGLADLDIDWATIMSYGDDANWNLTSWDPATPMVLDVIALQYLYGKNTATNAGNSTFNLKIDDFYKTIWDASGEDTVSAASTNVGWTIYLPVVQLSDLVDTLAGYAIPSNELLLGVPKNLTWLTGDIENIIGSGYNDYLVGNDFANVIKGGAGSDKIDGGTGADTLLGGAGNDVYLVDHAGDLVYETTVAGGTLDAGGVDRVESSVSYTLGSFVENLTLSAGAGDINGTGNGLANTITGNEGANQLYGGAGIDTLKGGDGDDTYTVDLLKYTINATTKTTGVKLQDVVTEASGQGTDTIVLRGGVSTTNVSTLGPGLNIENLDASATGSTKLNLTGNELDNTLTGNDSSNTLNGGVGEDTLIGGLGNDLLIGGLGSDILTGGDGNDLFRFDALLDVATNVDTITDFVQSEDKIQLDNAIFAKLTATGVLSADFFCSGDDVVAQDQNDYILYDNSGSLFYDQDGNGDVYGMIKFAELIGQPAISNTDFFIV